MDVIAARPMARHAFIEREKVEKTESGLILPGEDQRDRQHADTVFRGKVVALGDGEWDLVKLGDIVLFLPAESFELEAGPGKWVFTVPKKSILAVEEP